LVYGLTPRRGEELLIPAIPMNTWDRKGELFTFLLKWEGEREKKEFLLGGGPGGKEKQQRRMIKRDQKERSEGGKKVLTLVTPGGKKEGRDVLSSLTCDVD